MSTHYAEHTSGSNTFAEDAWPWALLIAGCLLSLLLLSFGLPGPFLLDDEPSLDALLKQDGSAWLMSYTGALGRPIAMLSFWLNGLLTGLSPASLRCVNLFIHALNGVLIFQLLRRLLPQSPGVAAVVSVLWLLHPLQASSVLYVIQRMTLLSATFTLVGLGMLFGSDGKPLADWRRPLLGLLFATLLAALSKENGVLTLPLAALVLLFVAQQRPLAPAESRLLTILVGLCGLGVLGFIALFTQKLNDPNSIVYLARGWGPWDRLLAEAGITWFYVAEILLPHAAIMSFHYDDWPIVPASLEKLLFSAAVWAWLGALIVATWCWHVGAFAVLFGLAWFLIGHSMESTVFPLELVFEHRNYLPSLGVLFIFAFAIRQIPLPKSAFIAVFLVVAVTLSWQTTTRAMLWGTPQGVAMHAWQQRPHSVRATASVAELLMAAGRPDAALRILAPFENPGARLHRLVLLCRKQRELSADTLHQTLMKPQGLRVDGYVVIQATALMDLWLKEQCNFPAADYARWLERLIDSGYLLAESSRSRLGLAAAQGLWFSGEFPAGLARLIKDGLETGLASRYFLAAEWSAVLKQCGRAEAYWREAFDKPKARQVSLLDWREAARASLKAAGCRDDEGP